MIICPKCGSKNINVQIINETNLKVKHHSLTYWVLIGWWLKPMIWLLFTIPMLILKLFKGKKYKTINKKRKYIVCQNCGNSEEI